MAGDRFGDRELTPASREGLLRRGEREGPGVGIVGGFRRHPFEPPAIVAAVWLRAAVFMASFVGIAANTCVGPGPAHREYAGRQVRCGTLGGVLWALKFRQMNIGIDNIGHRSEYENECLFETNIHFSLEN